MAARSSRVLITGGNTGIGYEVAKQLLQRGHDVLIACRDKSKAQNAVSRLQRASGSNRIDTVCCDLSSLASVRECAKEVNSRWPKLDVLVCNAAVITNKPTLTQDGFNTMYQVNHLSHVLLTHLLLPNLTTSDSGRIVVVGSQQYTRVPENLRDPMLFHRLSDLNHDLDPQQQQQQSRSAAAALPTPMQLYSVTKLYNLWFVKHFAAAVLPKLIGGSSNNGGSSSGSRLVINAVSPGFVPTSDLSRNLGGFLGKLVMKYIISWAPFAVSLQEAGSRVAALCDGQAEDATCGASYSKRVVEDVSGTAGSDMEKAAVLWKQSVKDLGIANFGYERMSS